MRRSLTLLVMAAVLLTACGTIRDSRVNPFNWFGGSREVPVETSAPATGEASAEAAVVNPLLPRRNRILRRPEAVYAGIPIEQVTGLEIEPTLSGAIVRATGVAARQGPYEVQLTPQNPEKLPVEGVLSFTFDVVYPNRATATGSTRSRRVTVAESLTHDDLVGVRVIRVVGAENARESRRR